MEWKWNVKCEDLAFSWKAESDEVSFV